MRIEVVLPKWGMTMQEGTIASWTVSPGTAVNEGDPIAIVETEKVETELLAPESGTVVEILVAEGATVEVGSLIAWLETP